MLGTVYINLEMMASNIIWSEMGFLLFLINLQHSQSYCAVI
jgi:hypothetical protein